MSVRVALFCLLALTVPAAAMQVPDVTSQTVEAEIEVLATQLFLEEMNGESTAEDEAILPQDATRMSLRRGVLSGLLEMCRRDWEDVSFHPFMAAMRSSGNLDGRRMAAVGLFHGIAQGQTVSLLSPRRAELCTQERIAAYEELARKRP